MPRLLSRPLMIQSTAHRLFVSGWVVGRALQQQWTRRVLLGKTTDPLELELFRPHCLWEAGTGSASSMTALILVIGEPDIAGDQPSAFGFLSFKVFLIGIKITVKQT